MPKAKTSLICPVCNRVFLRDNYEIKRNQEKGRTNVCGRGCQATLMNKSEKKLEHTKKMLQERNSNQWRENNPCWKGGRSQRLKDLPEENNGE